MHSTPLHILGNMLILYLLGLPLEERIGTRNFTIIYFSTGIVATVSFFLFHMDSYSLLLGASGAIYGIGGAFLILYPRDRVPMMLGPIFTTRAPIWITVGAMFAMETILVFMVFDDGIAHLAHVTGAITGIFLAPLIVKKTVDTKEESKIDLDALRSLAMNDTQREIVEKIANETEKDVRDAWLQYFFEHEARCPKCKRHVKMASVIKCECGETVMLMK